MSDERELPPCHTEKGVFIPGCWGGAIYGKSRCYCERPSKRDRLDAIERRLDKLEARLAARAPSDHMETKQ